MDEIQKTGIDFFDREIDGFLRGSRTIIIGPPGSGKTVESFAASCASSGWMRFEITRSGIKGL